MGRHCSICYSNEKAEIEAALRGGSTYRAVSARFKVGCSTIGNHLRHADGVRPRQLRKVEAVPVVTAEGKALADLAHAQVVRLLDAAESTDGPGPAYLRAQAGADPRPYLADALKWLRLEAQLRGALGFSQVSEIEERLSKLVEAGDGGAADAATA